LDELTGKIALVTGGSRGIGRAVAIGLAAVGVDIAVNFHHRHDAAGETAAEIQKHNRRAITVKADVSLSPDVARMVHEVESQLGGIDILVNNAGIARVQKSEQITEKDWDELISTNLKSCFLVTQAVLPGMRSRRWGRLIHLSSVAAQLGGVVGPHYAASKAGIIGLSHAYANQLAKEGITSNAIAPALVETEMVTANLYASPDRIPIGRFGTVEETAEVAVMLARNGFITGQTINVNGGLYMSS
jgi:3-oxoacyl-[acyl-carrier protein] reductase